MPCVSPVLPAVSPACALSCAGVACPVLALPALRLVGNQLALYCSNLCNVTEDDMKRYVMSFAASIEHVPVALERTAKRQLQSFDVEYQVWPNRASMAKTIRMQERREHRSGDWKACQALSMGEGY